MDMDQRYPAPKREPLQFTTNYHEIITMVGYRSNHWTTPHGGFLSHGGSPQIIQVMDDHDLYSIETTMMTWWSPIASETSIYHCILRWLNPQYMPMKSWNPWNPHWRHLFNPSNFSARIGEELEGPPVLQLTSGRFLDRRIRANATTNAQG